MSQSEPFYEAIFTPQLLENTFSPKSEKLERKIHFYILCYCLGGYWCEVRVLPSSAVLRPADYDYVLFINILEYWGAADKF